MNRKRGKKGIYIGILVLGVFCIAAALYFRSSPVIENAEACTISSVYYKGEDMAEEIDLQKLGQILARYRSRASLETAGPYQMEDVTVEINGSCAGRPFHIVLGESCFQYEHAGGNRRTILHGDELMEEIEEVLVRTGL